MRVSPNWFWVSPLSLLPVKSIIPQVVLRLSSPGYLRKWRPTLAASKGISVTDWASFFRIIGDLRGHLTRATEEEGNSQRERRKLSRLDWSTWPYRLQRLRRCEDSALFAADTRYSASNNTWWLADYWWLLSYHSNVVRLMSDRQFSSQLLIINLCLQIEKLHNREPLSLVADWVQTWVQC